MLNFNRTPNADSAAVYIQETRFPKHRGAAPNPPWDTDKTWCVVLYGNDGYKDDDDDDRQARTKTYVHGLYTGFANMLTEGAVEFGVSDDDYTWVIVLHLPKGRNLRGNHDAVCDFLHDMVWNAWEAQLPFGS